MGKERVENRTIFIPHFKHGDKGLAQSLNLLQKHVGNIDVDNERLHVIVSKDRSYISIAPKNQRINFDSLLFDSKGSDNEVRNIRVRFKSEHGVKSIFVLIRALGDAMFEIFETAPKTA